MKNFKNKKRLSGVEKLVKGDGTFDVTLDFLPDYMTASFLTPKVSDVVPTPRGLDGKAAASDSLYWELVAVSAAEFTFTVHYSCTYSRDIKWIVAKLPKEAESIAH